MKRFLAILTGLLLLVCIGQLGQADWKYNPFTGKLDYHETGLPTAGAAGDIVYYDGTDWQVLTAGANGLVLTLNSGLPTWIAAGAGADVKVAIDAAATAGYFGVAFNDGIFRWTQNHFTLADGGDFVTLSLADHATARTALGLGTASSPTFAGLGLTGELDLTGANACIDLNPASTATQEVISIIPTAELVAGRTFAGIELDLNTLDPATGDACTIYGTRVKMATLASTDHDANTYAFATDHSVEDNSIGYRSDLRELTQNKTQESFYSFGGTLALSYTGTYRGLHVDWDGMTRTANSPVLQGVNVVLPASYSNYGTSYAGYFSGDGRSVLLADTTYAIDASGYVRVTGPGQFIFGGTEYLKLDATTTDHTNSDGILDIEMTGDDGTQAIEVLVTSIAAGLGDGDNIYGMNLSLAADGDDHAGSILIGIQADYTPNSSPGKAYGIYMNDADFDYAIFVDQGAVRFDGVLYADGGIYGPAASALTLNNAVTQDINHWAGVGSGNQSLTLHGWNTAGGDLEYTELTMDDTNDEFLILAANSANHEGVTVSLPEANQAFRVRGTGGLVFSVAGSDGTVDVNLVDNALGYCYDAETTATPSGSFTVDWTAKHIQRVTITGVNLDITFTNPPGPCRLWLVVVQGDGDDTIDWTNEADIIFPGGTDPVLSTGNGDVDVVTFIWDGTNYLGVANYDFS